MHECSASELASGSGRLWFLDFWDCLEVVFSRGLASVFVGMRSFGVGMKLQMVCLEVAG